MSETNQREDSTLFLFAAGMILIFLVVPTLYAAKADMINGFLLTVAKMEIRPFLGVSEEAQKAWSHISAQTASTLTWGEMERILNYAGKWARWPFGILLAVMALAAWFMGRTDGLVRRFNMESLLKNNAESFPCLRPVVGRGKELLSPESYDRGLWRVARSPVQFAVKHKLLLSEEGKSYNADDVLSNGLGDAGKNAFGHAVFDEAGAGKVFRDQLGAEFSGVENLSPLRKSLAAAFLAYADGNKKEAVNLLDEMSSAYHEKDGQAECSILTDKDFQKKTDELFKRHGNVLKGALLARHNRYEMTWFMALLYRARQKGVLASSQFLFLRPLDRPLWYALNECGGRVGWPEAFAPWTHYQAEEAAGKSMDKPQTDRAVASLKAALDAQGWLKGQRRGEEVNKEQQKGEQAEEEKKPQQTEEKYEEVEDDNTMDDILNQQD